MFDVVEQLSAEGFSLIWLHPRQKRPIGNDWAAKPVFSAAELRESYQNGNNLGVRLGEPSQISGYYLQVVDVDVRDPAFADEAFTRLREFLPDWETFPAVKSGSGGPSLHVYFVTDTPFRSRKLLHSAEFQLDSEGKKHWKWEIELFGTGKQVAMPPSIHPTGNPYRWLREMDFDLIEMGIGPIVDSATIATWTNGPAPTTEDDEDDLLGYIKTQPLDDLTPEQIQETLSLLRLGEWCEDYEGWLTVGMALHHQYQGHVSGLDVWTTFSKQSKKFDPKELRVRWKGFKIKPDGVTFRTLLQAADIERQQRAEDDIAEDDLLGDVPDPDAPTVAWRALLELSADKSAYKPTLHNTAIIIRNDPGTKGLAALNLFTQEVVQRGTPGHRTVDKLGPKGCKQLKGPIWEVDDTVNGSLWTNVRDVAIRDVMEAPRRQGGYGIKLSDRDLRGAIDMAARSNSFHPVREYLGAHKWDGLRRAERLFIDYLGAPDTPYSRQVAKMFLVAAVTRIFEPGHKFDFAVILEGLQGKRKSTFIQILAKNWFAELDGDLHDSKQMVECMQGSWILEIPELSGFGRSDVRQIKAFISRTTDKVRLAYERRADQFPRQCVFMGSTNDREYLRDDTGGRRFWPVACEVDLIDTDRLLANVDQLWAEAHHLYRTMRKAQPRGALPLYLTDAGAAAEATEMQESRRIENAEDGLAGRISEWLDLPVRDDSGFEDEDADGGTVTRNVTCLTELWVACFQRDLSTYGQMQAQQLGRAMKKVEGWQMADRRYLPKFGRQRVFIRDGWDTL